MPAETSAAENATANKADYPFDCNMAIGQLEKLLEPNDAQRGRRAVDALIAAGFVVEDERGRLTPGRSPQRTG